MLTAFATMQRCKSSTPIAPTSGSGVILNESQHDDLANLISGLRQYVAINASGIGNGLYEGSLPSGGVERRSLRFSSQRDVSVAVSGRRPRGPSQISEQIESPCSELPTPRVSYLYVAVPILGCSLTAAIDHRGEIVLSLNATVG